MYDVDFVVGGRPFDVIEPLRKSKEPKYVNSGGLAVMPTITLEHHPTFTEFISGGMEMSLIVAIDFTASNGDPATPQSLHHIDPAGIQLNQYQTALRAVGGIIEEYDTDKMFPVFGFGGRIDSKVNHCFQIGSAPEHHGIAGINCV